MMKHFRKLTKWFEAFLVGGNIGMLAMAADYKHVILRGKLAVVSLVVGFAYIFIDHSLDIYGNELYYIACCVISLVTIFLIRAGKYKLSTILFVCVMSGLIYIFSASDTYRSGVYIFFVALCLTAFALFGYKDRKIALIFTVIAWLLFFYSYYSDNPYLPKRLFSEKYVQLSFIINFTVALIASIAIVYFLIDVNYHSEEQILAKNEQLAKANAELDRFVYSASHDMRAPLSSILGLVEVYKLSVTDDEKKQVIDLIQNRANKLDDFIREILDYSRNSRRGITVHPVDIMKLIHEVVEGLRYAKGFEKVVIETKPHAEPIVLTDTERIKVILNNLLANAIKYHDPYKPQPCVKIIFERSATSWCITVEDNGIGIHPDHQQRIFDMFYRAHENSEGSGLGLYISREAAERLGGTLALKSEYEKGSRFKLEFPVAARSL